MADQKHRATPPMIFRDGTPMARVERQLRQHAGVRLTTDEGFTLTPRGADRVIEIAKAAGVLLGMAESVGSDWRNDGFEISGNAIADLRKALGNKFDIEDVR